MNRREVLASLVSLPGSACLPAGYEIAQAEPIPRPLTFEDTHKMVCDILGIDPETHKEVYFEFRSSAGAQPSLGWSWQGTPNNPFDMDSLKEKIRDWKDSKPTPPETPVTGLTIGDLRRAFDGLPDDAPLVLVAPNGCGIDLTKKFVELGTSEPHTITVTFNEGDSLSFGGGVHCKMKLHGPLATLVSKQLG